MCIVLLIGMLIFTWKTALDKERNPLPFVFRRKACKEFSYSCRYGLDETNGCPSSVSMAKLDTDLPSSPLLLPEL